MGVFVQGDERGFIVGWWDVPYEEYKGLPKVCRRPDEDDWMNGDKLEKRPTMNLVVNGSRIDGVPCNATIAIEDQTFIADGNSVDIEGYSGEIGVSLWPYMDEVVTL